MNFAGGSFLDGLIQKVLDEFASGNRVMPDSEESAWKCSLVESPNIHPESHTIQEAMQ